MFYVWSSPNFGQKNGLIVSGEIFFWSSLFSNYLPPPLSKILRTLLQQLSAERTLHAIGKNYAIKTIPAGKLLERNLIDDYKRGL